MWISGEAARADVQAWRARSCAVLTGAGTVRADDPRLDVRLAYGPWVRQPLRVVLDPMLRARPAQGFSKATAPWCLPLPMHRRNRSTIAASNGCRAPPGAWICNAVMQRLTALEMNEVLLECGATLAGAFIASRLVDELVLYVAPRLLGRMPLR